MEFDSPEKEFPGLYMGDAGKTSTDPAVYEDDEKAKKKKDKKDSKKDKGYATLLAGESSHEEDELDPKSPGKTKKIKASFKLSAKKKDKKSVDKSEKERRNSSDKKPVEKEKEEKKKVEKEKDKKVDKKKKSLTGDILSVVPGSSSAATSPNTPLEKEKGLNLNMALNAFKNAPAPLPLLMKKDKESKKDKEASTSSKVSSKLKLKRSKNSLESESQSSQLSDIPIMVSHQFPEEPEAIVKEIKKYEALLEQTHSHMKSSKKVSKKSEEQLWELQRTLTQLKRKLRSINALSVGSVSMTAAVVNNSVSKDSTTTTPVVAVPAALLPPKAQDLQQIPSSQAPKNLVTNSKNGEERSNEITKPAAATEIVATGVNSDDDMKLDFTLKTATVDTTADFTVNNNSATETIIPSSFPNDSTTQVLVEDELVNENTAIVRNPEIESFSSITTTTLPHTLRDVDSEIPLVVGNSHSVNQRRSSNLNTAIMTTPESQVERVQVEVQVHAQASPNTTDTVNHTAENVTCQDEKVVVTPELHMDSTQLASIIKTLTFSDEEDDDNEEVTDVSCLSLVRINHAENGISSTDTCDGLPRTAARNANGEMDPFEMAVFETEDYLPIENEALIYFNEELQEEIAKEEQDIENLMEQLIQMKNNGVDIDAPEIGLDLDQFDNDEMIVSLWQITKLENEALNEHVNHLRKMVAVAKLEAFLLETRLKYLEDLQPQKNCVNPVAVVMNTSANSDEDGAN